MNYHICANLKERSVFNSDLDISFEANPITGDLFVLKDSASIRQSIRNLVLTSFYERPFHPNLGSQVANALFENYSDSLTEYTLTKSIENVIKYQEPRARNVEIKVNFDSSDASITATITFLPINSNRPDTVSIPLERIR